MKVAIIAVAILFAAALAGVVDSQPSGKKAVVAGPVYDGHEVTCDFPPAEQPRLQNIGSKIDGAGMCVFSSMEIAALAQGLEQMRGFRDWWASKSKGGGWPDQVDKALAAWFKYKGIEPIAYMQYEGKDPERVLEVIDKTGRMACITLGTGERYGMKPIAHMVCSPAYRGKYGVVLDNNFVAHQKGGVWNEQIYEWMDRSELCRRAKLGSGSAWVFVWLPPPPPPPARSKEGIP